MTYETENLDPFAFAGQVESEPDEYIIDQEGLALLPLLDDEPELGPLARELFEVEGVEGNSPWGKAPPEVAARYKELWPRICREPAATGIGGIAWRLGQIVGGLRDSDTPWDILAMAETALADAVRLHTGRREGADRQSGAALLKEWIAVKYSDCDDLDDEEINRISDEEIRLEGAILRAEPVTVEDWKAIVAVLLGEGTDGIAYVCVEAVENLRRRLIIDHIPHPAQRERALRESQWRVKDANGDDAGTIAPPQTVVDERAQTAALDPLPESLAAAEKEIADLWVKAEASSGVDTVQEDLITKRIFALETWIAVTAPTTLTEAAVKLRRLADPKTGLDAGDNEDDATSVRQVLALLEAALEAAIGGAA